MEMRGPSLYCIILPRMVIEYVTRKFIRFPTNSTFYFSEIFSPKYIQSNPLFRLIWRDKDRNSTTNYFRSKAETSTFWFSYLSRSIPFGVQSITFMNRCHFWHFRLLLTRYLHPSPSKTEVASAIIMITRFQWSGPNILDYSAFNTREAVTEVNKGELFAHWTKLL
jgi:hypothetical protein